MTVRIGYIGAGKMAESLISGLIENNFLPKSQVSACARTAGTRNRISKTYGIKTYPKAAEIVKNNDVIVLAVKPQQVPGLFAEEGMEIPEGKILVSIVAGLTIAKLKSYVPDAKIVRVMPNHCCQVLEGAMGYTCDEKVTDEEKVQLDSLFSTVGIAVEIPEESMDAVTGISGSSPAYIYMIIEAMADAGVMSGLSRADSIMLAAQTVLGSAKMVLETGKHPEQLKDEVCSPGGTTIVGVNTLENYRVRAAMIAAVTDTIEKSKELSKE